MGLYRNIAGVDGGQIGFGLTPGKTLVIPGVTDTQPVSDSLNIGIEHIHDAPTLTLPTFESNPATVAENQQAIFESFQNAGNIAAQTYDSILALSPFDFTAQGYILNDGSIFDTSGKIVLALQDIQATENARGTAGTLFMHLGDPVLAKDTAGFAGGGRASQGATTMYSTPIAEVLALPIPSTGPNVIMDYNPPLYVPPTVDPLPTGQQSPTTTTQLNTLPLPATGGSKNIVPLVTAAGLAAVALLGASFLKRKQRIVFVGGLGLLYYSMNKK